jgi:hypothetical protein
VSDHRLHVATRTGLFPARSSGWTLDEYRRILPSPQSVAS